MMFGQHGKTLKNLCFYYKLPWWDMNCPPNQDLFIHYIDDFQVSIGKSMSKGRDKSGSCTYGSTLKKYCNQNTIKWLIM